MTEPVDPFEHELRNVRPRRMSADAVEGIRARLEREGPSDRSRLRRRPVLVAVTAIAACVAMAFGLWRLTRATSAPALVDEHPQFARPGNGAVDRNRTQPTVMAYRQALWASPDALDSLLDAHAASFGNPVAAGSVVVNPAGAFRPENF